MEVEGGSALIEISHLTKKYGANVAVNDLNLTLESGNIYGFLGPNGAGKSTTMNIITGYIGASSGEVKIPRRQRNASVICRKFHQYMVI